MNSVGKFADEINRLVEGSFQNKTISNEEGQQNVIITNTILERND